MDVRAFLFLSVLLIGCLLMAESRRPPSESRLSVQSSGCACDKKTDNCGCCAHIKFDVLHVKVDDDACVNITYLSKEYGLSLTLAWNGKIIFNETVSASNPPPFCIGVPHVKLLDVCIRLYNISYDKQRFGGCIEIEFEVLHIKKGFPLGCIYSNQVEAHRTFKAEDILTALANLWRIFKNKFQTVRGLGDVLDDTKRSRTEQKQSFSKPLTSVWNTNVEDKD